MFNHLKVITENFYSMDYSQAVGCFYLKSHGKNEMWSVLLGWTSSAIFSSI